MILTIALTLHLLAVVVWVGGMFFAHMILRPTAAELLEPPLRFPLLLKVFTRFFLWVWIAVILLWLTGLWIIWDYGGLSPMDIHIHIMLNLAGIMTLLFVYLFFIPFPQLKQATAEHNFAKAANYLNSIRRIVATNLLLGLLIILIVKLGRQLVL
ncbi:hypothetical protein THII_2530 [Thioploca ingrica]|uniref:Copper resistance protein D domain-containing protein n=1 Tax=Thioploca ingrica TaxID=40754 RepID=A0A090ALX2_9GAMM|nr:hypothetical protein THII_2530 [Thioploca ingrica]